MTSPKRQVVTGKCREDRRKEMQSEPGRGLLEKEKAEGAEEPPRSQAGVLRRLPRREKMIGKPDCTRS